MASRGRGGIRLRATVGATSVVVVAMVAASIMLVTVVADARDSRVREAAEMRSSDLVALLDDGVAAASLLLEEGDDRFAQVVDGDGEVLASSRDLAGLGSLVGRTGTGVGLPLGDGDDLWIVVADTTADGALTVVVGREMESRAESTRGLVLGLIVAVPLLALVVAATTWWVVGKALAPVDAIRREADEIGAGELHRRVPEPGTTDEIGRLAETVNTMLARLEAAQLRQRRFVSDASHELRSPVANIASQVDVARAHPERVDTDALVDTIGREILRVDRLVDDLLVLARLDEGGGDAGAEAVDLDDLVLDALAGVDAALTVDRHELSAGQVVGDRRLLARLVRNLVDNAAHHAGERVTVSLVERNGHVVLTVDDDGPGVAPADRRRVFERFVRLDEGRSRDRGGSGLGLAIVAEVASHHGGRVVLSESPIGGARIVVDLPSSRGGSSG